MCSGWACSSGCRAYPDRAPAVPGAEQQEYTTELTQTLQQAAPRPQSTEEEERKKHILSLRNLLAAILILLAILTLLIVWGW